MKAFPKEKLVAAYKLQEQSYNYNTDEWLRKKVYKFFYPQVTVHKMKTKTTTNKKA